MIDKEVLRINNVTKLYGNQKALDNVTISVKEGEVAGLIGPNGAGKSTLMKIIVGLIRNYEGNVFIEGENVLSETNKNKKRAGCVIENPGFYPELSGYDNLLYFSKISGCSGKEDIDNIINLLGIKDFVHKKARKYSLGMKQRLGLAQAVLGNPKLLVLDEPTNGLDPNVILNIREFIKYLSEEKRISVIISSHILTEIELMCKKVFFIKNGIIVDEVRPADNLQNPEGSCFVFETDNIRELKDFFKAKNIYTSIHGKGKVIADLKEYSIREILSMLLENNINILGTYRQKASLEKRFIEIMEENIIE
ncbi:ABC-2 type transport system ATP-binding protein [Anaerobacterium chartisolvens]|uniref:ABC-2 type transport system ATP-binding protein n=1 Tax=Anaerobacterium chartisolvens TaxID=1297424 RepID=A0A369BFW8_9FIRM|nr:ABC transporter ATP-binding protein [Anaerobacterium chartisolvens]RCX19466.1 ABC-2 type transport system ATP-binding protein [Anaerobacterium chartisolvens]